MNVAAPSNASTTCAGGTLTAIANSTTVSYTGGTVPASTSCTVSVDVVATLTGSLVNTTGDLTSSLGNSGTASDTLTVNSQPIFSKEFMPNSILAGETTTLTFTVDNSANSMAATGIGFVDSFPLGLAIDANPNAMNTCTGGTLTALAGTFVVNYSGGSVAAGTSCQISVTVFSDSVGTYNYASGDLNSSLGNSGGASSTLIVSGPILLIKVPTLNSWALLLLLIIILSLAIIRGGFKP
jgi:hypothetical protein